MISYVSMRDADDLRAFAGLDWAALARSKDRYRREQRECRSPADAIRIADELRQQAHAQNPHYPSEEDRRKDLAAHARLLAVFDRFEAWRRSAPH